MNEEYREQYLMHYGVLGMKWGVRRKRDKQSSSKKSSKQEFEVKNNIKQPKAKGRKQDFDEAEFQKRLQQLRMEVEYDRLVSTLESNNSTMRKVENFTKNVTTIATLTGSALMIYNNLDKAHNILDRVKKKK